MAARKASDLGRHSGTLTLADFYLSAAARSDGAAAEQAADGKSAKYDELVQSGRLLQPIAAETLGPLNEFTILLLSWAVRSRLFQVAAESPASFFSVHICHHPAIKV